MFLFKCDLQPQYLISYTSNRFFSSETSVDDSGTTDSTEYTYTYTFGSTDPTEPPAGEKCFWDYTLH